jgi:hypothetical protein
VRTERISNLPNLAGGDIDSTSFLVSDGVTTGRVTMKQIADTLVGNMGVAVIRCKHCGQWGARFCECRKCGGPIE